MQSSFNPFHATRLFLYPLKTSENVLFSDVFRGSKDTSGMKWVNPLSANPTKLSNTLKQFVGKLPTNCLSVFDNFVKLAFKRLKEE